MGLLCRCSVQTIPQHAVSSRRHMPQPADSNLRLEGGADCWAAQTGHHPRICVLLLKLDLPAVYEPVNKEKLAIRLNAGLGQASPACCSHDADIA